MAEVSGYAGSGLYLLNQNYIRLFLPLFSYEIKTIHPEYIIKEFSLNDRKQIMYQVEVFREGVDVEGRTLGGSEARAGLLGRTMYISPIVVFYHMQARSE